MIVTVVFIAFLNAVLVVFGFSLIYLLQVANVGSGSAVNAAESMAIPTFPVY